jgi:hypothetical protein
MKDDPWKFPPDVAHRLTLLASPNYATIAKMMELEGHPTNVSIFGSHKGEILRGDELYPTS